MGLLLVNTPRQGDLRQHEWTCGYEGIDCSIGFHHKRKPIGLLQFDYSYTVLCQPVPKNAIRTRRSLCPLVSAKATNPCVIGFFSLDSSKSRSEYAVIVNSLQVLICHDADHKCFTSAFLVAKRKTSHLRSKDSFQAISASTISSHSKLQSVINHRYAIAKPRRSHPFRLLTI